MCGRLLNAIKEVCHVKLNFDVIGRYQRNLISIDSFSSMALSSHRDNADEVEDESSDEDDGFDEDMEALRKACMSTNTNIDDEMKDSVTAAPTTSTTAIASEDESEEDDLELVRNIQKRFSIPSIPSEDESEDDLELVRNIQKRFCIPSDAEEHAVSLKPLAALPPVDLDDDEDDFETLRAIERRFVNYDTSEREKFLVVFLTTNIIWRTNALKKNSEDHVNKPEQVECAGTAPKHGTSSVLLVDRDNGEAMGLELPNFEQACNTSLPLESFSSTVSENQPSTEWHQLEASDSTLPQTQSGFPDPSFSQVFIDAIKKNRSCQKFIRSKLIEIEARIEENKKLKARVKLLKDFQVECKKRAGRAISQRKDARVQLISVCKSRTSQNMKTNHKKLPPLYFGPAENPHAVNYRMMLTRSPLTLGRQRWTDTERENLSKGIKQQFQELLLQKSIEQYSDSGGSSGDSNSFDEIVASITDLEITPEQLRSFLPKIDWDRLASMYVVGRSGSECEQRWLNVEDPLICHDPWTKIEDKNLLFILQQRGVYNWINISVSLGTNRTPFQCLSRYQRSLNANIMKREWTKDDDSQLRAAVEYFGEKDWQRVAKNLLGRTGVQCSNRWHKSLHPDRKRVGKWTVEEDKRLKVAVMLFGPKTWKKIAQFISGRTQVQCRERWMNCLDPSLNLKRWTNEEDCRLKAAIADYGYCWAKVAASVPPRTDSQCRRRWKVLFPHEVPLLQAARKIQKAALISNFVDRETERPALGPGDFLPLPSSEHENGKSIEKPKRKSRGKAKSQKQNEVASCNAPKKVRSKRSRTEDEICPEANSRVAVGDDAEANGEHTASANKRRESKRRRIQRNQCTEQALGDQDILLCPEDSTILRITNLDAVEAVGEDDSTLKKNKKKTPKRISKKNKYSGAAENNQGPSLCPEQSAISQITDGDGVGFSVGDVALSSKKKKVPKKQPRLNNSTESMRSLETTDGDVIDASGITTPEKRREERKSQSGRPIELAQENLDFSLFLVEQQCSTSGASLPSQNQSKKSRTRVSSSKQIPDEMAGDEMTLALFLRNMRLKRAKKEGVSTFATGEIRRKKSHELIYERGSSASLPTMSLREDFPSQGTLSCTTSSTGDKTRMVIADDIEMLSSTNYEVEETTTPSTPLHETGTIDDYFEMVNEVFCGDRDRSNVAGDPFGMVPPSSDGSPPPGFEYEIERSFGTHDHYSVLSHNTNSAPPPEYVGQIMQSHYAVPSPSSSSSPPPGFGGHIYGTMDV